MSIYKLRTNFGTHFKYILLGVAFIFVVGAIFTFAGAPGGGPEQKGAEQVVATVNGMPITKAEMESQWQRMSEALREMRSTLQIAQQRASLFQSLVESRVTLATAEAMGVEINKKDIQNKREELVTEYLRQNRSRVLGKLSTEEDKVDPRRDRTYKSELSKGGMNITMLERQANALITDGQISSQLAQEGIQKAIERKVGTITRDDIKNSYNTYQIRQIVMMQGSTPAEQFESQVKKVAAEAKTGDFAALARKYSVDPEHGAVRAVRFGMVASDVWDKINTMKPGQVSEPIGNNQATYIVKVESTGSEYPSKLTKKAEDQRRDMIKNMRQMQAYLKYNQQVRDNLKVVVTDPELSGYWHLGLAQQADSEAAAKKQITLARNSFEKAIGLEPNNSFATAMLAAVLVQQQDTKKATQLLYQFLEGKDSRAIGTDLRIMLGDLLYKAGKKDEGLVQYNKGAQEAGFDVSAHQQIMAKYKEIGRDDLAAEEQKWIKDYEEKKRIYEAQQRGSEKSAPAQPAPQGGGE